MIQMLRLDLKEWGLWSDFHERVLADYWVSEAELQEARHLERECVLAWAAVTPGVEILESGSIYIEEWVVEGLEGVAAFARIQAITHEANKCRNDFTAIEAIHQWQQSRDLDDPTPIEAFRNCLEEHNIDFGANLSNAQLSHYVWDYYDEDGNDLLDARHPEAAWCRDRVSPATSGS
ncbi:MAG: hypothetical protein FWD83_09995 [Promicromonosporaceae bacterium]|nr:hypothetical protein [Promicromonosporaceae bacterium]